jgi:hypothetical protein
VDRLAKREAALAKIKIKLSIIQLALAEAQRNKLFFQKFG